jgi:hypothetical protein
MVAGVVELAHARIPVSGRAGFDRSAPGKIHKVTSRIVYIHSVRFPRAEESHA